MHDPLFGWELSHPSRREPVLAGDMVATSQPLAVQAGLETLRRGGNAVDAAAHPGNRGADRNRNEAGPRRRPFNTIIPAFLFDADGRPAMAFGVMGGPMQPQGHVQLSRHILDRGENPQAAIDAPCRQVTDDWHVAVEPGFSEQFLGGLEARGHRVQRSDPALFGGAQAIWRLADGYLGASDARKDGMAAGF